MRIAANARVSAARNANLDLDHGGMAIRMLFGLALSTGQVSKLAGGVVWSRRRQGHI